MTSFDSSSYSSGSSDFSSLGLGSDGGSSMTSESHCSISTNPSPPRPNQPRRKSVTFSPVSQTVFVDSKLKAKVPSIHDKPPVSPVSNSSNGACYERQQINTHPSLNSSITQVYFVNPIGTTAPPSPLKRFYSDLVTPFSDDSKRVHAQSYHDAHSGPPRRRSFSERPPDKIVPLATDDCQDARRNSSLNQSKCHTVLPARSTSPPAEFCAAANHRIRRSMQSSTFDYSQHVRHRTYIIRNVEFSTSDHCVLMLDAGVEALLPQSYSLLPPNPIDTFTISRADGKGKGLFATRILNNLDIILTERPVVVTPYVIGVAAPLPQLYADIFAKLSTKVFDTLVNISSHEKQGNKSTDYEAIIRLNALAVELSVPNEQFAELPTHRAVFLQTSRCNHSCGPNAKWEWNPSTFSLTLIAVREIKPGEEITIAYVPPHLPYQYREAGLRDMYSVECTCKFCTQSPESIEKSDAARIMLSNFWDPVASGIPKFETWCKVHSLSSDTLLKAHNDAIHLLIREGLHVLDTESVSGHVHPQRDLGRHIDRIAMCYGAMEDVDNFRKYIQMALDAQENAQPEVKLVFKKWLSNPASFPAWGWRTNSSKRPSSQYMDSTKVMPS